MKNKLIGSGAILVGVSVYGAHDIQSVGRRVWMYGGNFSVTQERGQCVGVLTKWIGMHKCDIMLFNRLELTAMKERLDERDEAGSA